MNELPGSEAGGYNPDVLGALGLIWCSGSGDEKASAFLKLVNPPSQGQGRIAWLDKDLHHLVAAVVEVAGPFAIRQAHATGDKKYMPDIKKGSLANHFLVDMK